MAEWTGLEPATPGVTGRYSNQLNYHSALSFAQVLTKAGIIHEIRSLFPVVDKKFRAASNRAADKHSASVSSRKICVTNR